MYLQSIPERGEGKENKNKVSTLERRDYKYIQMDYKETALLLSFILYKTIDSDWGFLLI